MTVLHVRGRGAAEAFGDEAGGHRWQRIPPSEKRGRVHSSTVTVAVLPEPTATEVVLRDADLEWAMCRGSGAGGQSRNKTESAVTLVHRPSGVRVRFESERSQQQNKGGALAVLRARLWEAERARRDGGRSAERRQQVGSGMRGASDAPCASGGTVTDTPGKGGLARVREGRVGSGRRRASRAGSG
ncbi:MAG: peptide chain release factor-like protein [Polyangiaceae bacterium]